MPGAPPDIAKELQLAEVEAFRQTQIRELMKAYRAALKVTQVILLGPAVTDFARARAEELKAQINEVLRELREDGDEWAQKVIPLSYQRGVKVAERQIRRLGLGDSVNTGAHIHTGAVNVLIDSLAQDLRGVDLAIHNTSFQYIRRAQIVASQDRQITRAVAQGLIQGETRIATTDRILGVLRQSIATGQMVRINGINYQPDKYAALLARTRTREATTQGTLNSALQFGMDLVMFDTHDDPCPWCQQYSGRVFSLSGNHPNFPALEVRAPIHPNCECTMHPTTEEHLQASGDYDRLVVLSNDPKVPMMDNDAYKAILGAEADDLSKAEKAVRRAQPLTAPRRKAA